MVMSYFTSKKREKSKEKPTSPSADKPLSPPVIEPVQTPILNDEEEKFLTRITSESQEPEGTPPPLPERPVVILDNGKAVGGKDAQRALLDGADVVPLPMSPGEEKEVGEKGLGESEKGKGKEKEKDAEGRDKRSSFISYFSTVPGRFKSVREKGKGKEKVQAKKDKEKAADQLHTAAENADKSEQEEVKQEEQDLSAILDQLNLSAVNNRVFSFSKESTELLERFKLVLKDIVNGAPTAYNDLEKLLTDSEGQLKKMYGSLPPFLQNLVKSLPAKMTAGLAPELMAATSEKPGFDAKMATAEASGSKKKRSKRSRMVPPLKSLVSEKGAVAAMLKSILNFLKLRFPAFVTGTNVLMSLAIFILLFVFWYCHKRGRETRLEKERLAAEAGGSADDGGSSGISDLEDSIAMDEKTAGGSSKEKSSEPPLVIHDTGDEPSATVDDLPSVLHLPEPSSVPLPNSEAATPAREKEPALKK